MSSPSLTEEPLGKRVPRARETQRSQHSKWIVEEKTSGCAGMGVTGLPTTCSLCWSRRPGTASCLMCLKG